MLLTDFKWSKVYRSFNSSQRKMILSDEILNNEQILKKLVFFTKQKNNTDKKGQKNNCALFRVY